MKLLSDVARPTLHFPGGCSRLAGHVTEARALEGGEAENDFGSTLKERARDCPENAGVSKPLLAAEASCTRGEVRSRGSVSESGGREPPEQHQAARGFGLSHCSEHLFLPVGRR